ncbi:Adenylate kinase [Gemmata obscuriglobus]|uniref:Adenylate kinase n=1 Tax=Gemmata obscuriglobus TaxID=114 RepID=A0A2Z3H0I2_9BACT|nr:nucleoside monophosphate kinase [Gemmata obscuriglobus]AWM38351.1 adenylate kinase [Gemmata obscuriglobus]QEG28734.1 Adenylate kinase [Gemmata obscuriglobus]VTS07031.1 adenylate kinase : Adenylate kinase OS=Verrucomicrobiae bacterium DG1235 GN=VDG1235_1936 PE=3 SV=1: ADK [Gemmata obscuriglobus UQM 2246]
MTKPDPAPRPPAAPADLEIKDAQLIFPAVWADLLEKHGADVQFPSEFIWLGGAPGAGKGTNTPFIARARDITAPPVVISALLTTPQAVAIKNAGQLVGDREVVALLLEELLHPQYRDGVIVDGFPRTKVQVECLKLFYHALLARGGPPPMFRIALLFVTEEVSVERQLKRGREVLEHNRQVRASGAGERLEERVTDLDPGLCRKRYQGFKDTTFDALQSLRQIFHFHFIEADGDLGEVQRNIVREFAYQSSLELSPEVFQSIQHLPLATELARHARQELVRRLEQYARENPDAFRRVIGWIETKLLPIVHAHAMSGHAQINSEEALLDDPTALRMMIDVLSERGFHVTVDLHRVDVPERVDPQTWAIICQTKKVFRIEIRYPPSDIRRGH